MDDFLTKVLSSRATERLRFLHEGALFGIGEVVNPLPDAGAPGADEGVEAGLLVGALGLAAREFPEPPELPELPDPVLLDPPEGRGLPEEGGPAKISFCAPKNMVADLIESTGRTRRKKKNRNGKDSPSEKPIFEL